MKQLSNLFSELADPSKAKSDSEAMYLMYKKQYQLNEKWILDIIKDSNPKKINEVIRHLLNLRNLSPHIIVFEEAQRKC